MKKISIANAITVLAASAFLIACNAYDQDLSPGGNTVIEAVCPAPALEEPATRTAVDPTAYTSGEIGINWLPADRIGVYSATTANACFTNQSDQETDKTSFAGNLQNGGDSPVCLLSLYGDGGHRSHGFQGHAAADPALFHRHPRTGRRLEGGHPQGSSASRFTFEHIFAFLKFDINAGGTDVAGERLLSVSLTVPDKQLGGGFTCDLSTRAVTFTPATDASTVTMEWTDTPELSASTFHGYMNVAPVTGIAGRKSAFRSRPTCTSSPSPRR